jgi:hypothetical protein
MLLVLAGCSEDSSPKTDRGTTGDGQHAVDLGTVKNADALLWPDWPVNNDQQVWTCIAGQAGMCGDNKRSSCTAGKCTPCPVDHVDCDRTGDCECVGACNGTKCAGSK